MNNKRETLNACNCKFPSQGVGCGHRKQFRNGKTVLFANQHQKPEKQGEIFVQKATGNALSGSQAKLVGLGSWVPESNLEKHFEFKEKLVRLANFFRDDCRGREKVEKKDPRRGFESVLEQANQPQESHLPERFNSFATNSQPQAPKVKCSAAVSLGVDAETETCESRESPGLL